MYPLDLKSKGSLSIFLSYIVFKIVVKSISFAMLPMSKTYFELQNVIGKTVKDFKTDHHTRQIFLYLKSILLGLYYDEFLDNAVPKHCDNNKLDSHI